MIVTLAVTGIVPRTVDPDVGAVMVTTRLPSCAKAGSGDIQNKHKRTKRNFATAGLQLDPFFAS